MNAPTVYFPDDDKKKDESCDIPSPIEYVPISPTEYVPDKNVLI